METKVKVIKDYPSYLISSDGKVYSTKSNRYIKQHKHHKGYAIVRLSYEGKRKNVRVHRLIAKAFIPNPNNYPIVRHLNDNKEDNRMCNLAWGTNSDNMKDMFSNGYKSHLRHLSEEQISEIKCKYSTGNYTYKTLAELYGVASYVVGYAIRTL